MRKLVFTILFILIGSVAYSATSSSYNIIEKIKWRDHQGKSVYSLRIDITTNSVVSIKYFYFTKNPSTKEVRSAVDNYIACMGG